METKCNFCGKYKPTTEFVKTSGFKCKACRNEYHAAYREEKRILSGKPSRNILTPEFFAKKEQKAIAKEKKEQTESQRKEQMKYLARKSKRLIRKQNNRIPDREFYVIDEAFENRFYLDFSYLRDIPLERLSLEYYDEPEESIIDQCLRLSAEFLKNERKVRLLTQYERKTRSFR